MKRIFFIICSFLLLAGVANSCFGPKLYLGIKPGPEGALRYALVSIYIKEKTGTEVERVLLAIDENPRDAINGEKVDFAFSEYVSGETSLLSLSENTVLYGGKRIKNDLQFTTTIPALSKLNRKSLGDYYPVLLEKVKNGAAPLALARKFYFDRGWI